MTASDTNTKDPVCGMTVDKATALHVKREGQSFFFCSDHCRSKFLATSSTKASITP